MNILPRGINKIIEEYCYYPGKFHDELLNNTKNIYFDSISYWNYENSYVWMEYGYSYHYGHSYIARDVKGIWDVDTNE